MSKLLYLLLLVPGVVFADNLSYKFGLGATSNSVADGKVTFFNASYERPLTSILDQKYEGGVWTDMLGEGRKSSGYANYSVGIKVEPGVFYAQAYVGVALITHPDTQLGSHGQFTHDIGFGFQDAKKKAMGLNIKHISNAGLKKPNIGRNFVQLEVKIPL